MVAIMQRQIIFADKRNLMEISDLSDSEWGLILLEKFAMLKLRHSFVARNKL